MKNLLKLFVLSFALIGCRDEVMVSRDESALNRSASVALDTEYISSSPYNLNVVLFVPKDQKINPDYEDRISETLTYEQNYIKDWMNKWGYGDLTFGLLKNAEGKVKINIVYGKEASSSYPYSGGEPKMWAEIMEYFKDKPSTSEHYFVLTTVNKLGEQKAPYYGIGRKSYGIDFPDMKIGNMKANPASTDTIASASAWIGGNFHEMLHGFGLPHNGGLVSNNTQYGQPVITGNGGNFVVSKSSMDAWDCALLLSSQLFSKTTRSDWYSDVTAEINKINAKYDADAKKIIISGEFTSNKKVLYVGYTNDAKRNANDGNYDSENWVSKPTETNSFNTEIPISELKNLGNYRNDLTISLICENGSRPNFQYSYQMIDGIPHIEVINTKDLLKKTDWVAIDTDSQESADVIGNILDGKSSTIWHTKWRGGEAPLPHQFVVDMGVATTVNGFAFANRSNLNGAMKDIEIFKSNDNSTWTSVGTFSLKAQQSWQYVDLAQAQSMRYVKVKVTSTNGGFNYTHLAEFGAY